MAKKLILLLIVALIGVVGYLGRHKVMGIFQDDTRTTNTSEVKLLFREAPTAEILSTKLVEKGIIPNKKMFDDFVAAEKIVTDNFAAGKYVILSATQLSDLVHGFVKGDNGHGKAEVKVNVTFNRCIDIQDIGANISQCILADSASIVDYILDPETLKKYGFTEEQVPALFIPKQYQMYFDTDAEEFIAFMASEFKKYWTAERMQKIKNIGLKSPSQVVTIASIVYSEQSRVSEEWPTIAKLYLNRIERGIPLEADPTFKFCWPDRLKGVEHLLDVHKNRDCPYNTYLHKGVPPGPICIPPYDVVDAVLDPAGVDYIFLCGDGTGHHNFASTNSEHNKNVAAYRIWLKDYMKNKDK